MFIPELYQCVYHENIPTLPLYVVRIQKDVALCFYRSPCLLNTHYVNIQVSRLVPEYLSQNNCDMYEVSVKDSSSDMLKNFMTMLMSN